MLKVLRWRRKVKRKKSNAPPKSYVKGKVINGEHELYTLSIAVMIGVRTSIESTNQILQGEPHRWVGPADFNVVEKYEMRPKGGITPPHRLAHTFKFKDYAPIAFAYLRRMYGVNDFDFLMSVCGKANFIEFISNAKSGQFFFYSNDGKYMIKTMTNTESRFLRRSKYTTCSYFCGLLCLPCSVRPSSILSPLLREPQYDDYAVLWDVPCQALPSQEKC